MALPRKDSETGGIGEGARVLLVDDEPAVLQVLCLHLARKGFRVTTCLSGHEALRLFAPARFDVVITDMRMPGMDGLDLLKAIRQRDPLIPALVLTGYGTLDNAIRAFREGGVDDYLLKPLENIADLSEAAARAVARGRSRRQELAAARRVRLLSRIIEWSEDYLLVCSPDGAILCANRAAEALFGGEDRPLVGGHLCSLAPRGSPHRRRLAEMVEEAGGGGVAEGEVAMVSADGGRRLLWVKISLLRPPDAATGVLVVRCSERQETSPRSAAPTQQLTPRETEVARLIAAGYSNREIAERLFVSEVTVKTHVSAILRKLGARDRLQLAVQILASGQGIER